MYAIEPDISRNLICVRLGGLMSVKETAAYMGELRQCFAPGRFRAGYRILVDGRDCTVQSQNMIEAMRGHMADMPKASRIAMVTGSSLARMQVRRLMTQSYADVFTTVEDALLWLLEDRAAA